MSDHPTNKVIMLITFRTETYADITLFGDIAVQLLKMVGHSGAVPGAILAADIPAALARLKQALAANQAVAPADTQDEEAEDEDANEPTVGLAQRAFPLIELLTAAAKAHSNVAWE